MILDAILDEVIVSLGLSAAASVWRWGWPRIQGWARDFALVDLD